MRISDWSSDVCSSDLTNLDDFNTREQCYANASAGGLGRAILKSKEDRPTWTIGLDYQAADNVFLYAVTRRGFREGGINRSEEHTSELQSLMRTSYAVFCLYKKKRDGHIVIARSPVRSTDYHAYWS